jgi:hypothetical protein
MKNASDWLRDLDPVPSEPPLTPTDVQRLRRAIADAAPERRPFRAGWRGVAAAAAMAALAAVAIARWPDQSAPKAAAPGEDVSAAQALPREPRQLQFVTASGTKVIWIFNPAFHATEGSRP